MADKIFVRSWGALAVTVLGVFATLMYVIHRAIQTINSGAANLVEANKQLQQEIAEHARAEAEKLRMQNKHSNFLSLVRDEFKGRERAGEDTE
jgi:Tfp pilus assembly protein PilN